MTQLRRPIQFQFAQLIVQFDDRHRFHKLAWSRLTTGRGSFRYLSALYSRFHGNTVTSLTRMVTTASCRCVRALPFTMAFSCVWILSLENLRGPADLFQEPVTARVTRFLLLTEYSAGLCRESRRDSSAFNMEVRESPGDVRIVPDRPYVGRRHSFPSMPQIVSSSGILGELPISRRFREAPISFAFPKEMPPF